MSLPVFGVRPSGVHLDGERYSGCDDDGGFAFAGQHYRPMPSRDDVKAFYRSVVAADGWAPVDDHDRMDEGLCFLKKINGLDAYLVLWFPHEYDSKIDDAVYALEVKASRYGPAGC